MGISPNLGEKCHPEGLRTAHTSAKDATRAGWHRNFVFLIFSPAAGLLVGAWLEALAPLLSADRVL